MELSQAIYLRQQLLTYIPKMLHWQVDMTTIRSLLGQELKELQGHSAQDAQISFISASEAGLLGAGRG